MLIRKKISLGFIISASIIALLVVFEYINFREVGREIKYLEITDTIRSKSLQLRRHEKNYFLFSPARGREEAGQIMSYISQLEGIADQNIRADKSGKFKELKVLSGEYRSRFKKIEDLLRKVFSDFAEIKPLHQKHRAFFPLIETTFYDRPFESANTLVTVFGLAPEESLVLNLKELDLQREYLRKIGEDILTLSKELDQTARERADRGIRNSQIALLTFFPLFLLIGIGSILVISTNVVKRLNLLISTVGKTGGGNYPKVAVPRHLWGRDEVGALISGLSDMEEELERREEELKAKNRELLQSKKLAVIGTLAAGVAHELNNPLNNIYLSAQIAEREGLGKCPPLISETIKDIGGQTLRLKRIVGDLLEFARAKEPDYRPLELNSLIEEAYSLTAKSSNLEKIRFVHASEHQKITLQADYGQLERVFINLFANSAEAMSGEGTLTVNALDKGDSVQVKISDTGKGIREEDIDKIFDPFFSTREKGTGLGLAIVLNIIMRHGGEIGVESKEGQGASFLITLPKIQPKEIPENKETEKEKDAV
jgi:signal transduction histidine kinase